MFSGYLIYSQLAPRQKHHNRGAKWSTNSEAKKHSSRWAGSREREECRRGRCESPATEPKVAIHEPPDTLSSGFHPLGGSQPNQINTRFTVTVWYCLVNLPTHSTTKTLTQNTHSKTRNLITKSFLQNLSCDTMLHLFFLSQIKSILKYKDKKDFK